MISKAIIRRRLAHASAGFAPAARGRRRHVSAGSSVLQRRPKMPAGRMIAGDHLAAGVARRAAVELRRVERRAFSPDGQYLYVGNFVDGNIDILRRSGDTLAKVGSLALPGHPACAAGLKAPTEQV
jgi:hypothetical protein